MAGTNGYETTKKPSSATKAHLGGLNRPNKTQHLPESARVLRHPKNHFSGNF
ncbi:MAG: hypothetical protein WCC04_18090 [Terriglobales bacterium]